MTFGGRSRFFESGEVRLAILSLLGEGPKHGYQLMKELAERSGGIYRASAGSIYPTLQQLEDEGLVTSVQQDGKRVYQITLAGSNELQRWLDDTALTEERSRNLFLVRIFFGDRTSRERLAALLDQYEAAARTRVDLLAALVDRLAGRPESVFRRSTAMFGLRHEQAKVDWVTDLRPILLAAAAPETLTVSGGG